MKIGVMRLLDRAVGKPIAWTLGLFVRRGRSGFGDTELKPEAGVICLKLVGLGSTVLALPLFAELRARKMRVTVVTFPDSAELTSLSGLVDEVLVVEKSFKNLLPSLWRVFTRCRAIGADVVIDLEPSAYLSAVFTLLTGIEQRLGFLSGNPIREKLFTHHISYSNESHLSANFLKFAARFGGEIGEGKLPAPPAAYKNKTSDDDIIINVNTSELSTQRLWPTAHWGELGRLVLEKYPEARLDFTGLPSEATRVRDVIQSVGRRNPSLVDRMENSAGSTDLMQLLEKIARAKLVISVDSSLVHLAAWVGTPVVAIFGPESPNLVAPLSAHSESLSLRLPCSPCLNVVSQKRSFCRNNLCMQLLTPEMVFEKCRPFLKRGRNAKAA